MSEWISITAPKDTPNLFDVDVRIRSVTVGEMRRMADVDASIMDLVEEVDGYGSIDDVSVRMGVMITKGILDYLSGEAIKPATSATSWADSGSRQGSQRTG